MKRAMYKTERLILRPIAIEDSNSIESLASDYQVAKSTLTIPHPYPKGSAFHFIKSMHRAEREGRIQIYSILSKEAGTLIGIINISLRKEYERGELAYWIGKPYWGKGYGTEAAKEVIRIGFEERGLNRIFAASFTDNPGSSRIMEKIGMKHEGVLRQHVMKEGKYKDLTYYSILKSEFHNNQ
jgi:ribosomal-protein-alanine N-acetyltransferase